MKKGIDPDDAFDDLLDLLLYCHRVWEEVVPGTLERFDADEEEVDPYHYSNCVRYKARTRLKRDQEKWGYELRTIPNSGIELTYKGWTLKFVKAVAGSPPAPGRSQARMEFYQQPLFEQEQPRKLIVTWHVAWDRSFEGLEVSCPRDCDDARESPRLHWSRPVPHPATVQTYQNPYDPAPADLDEIRHQDDKDDWEDLDIDKEGTGDE